MADNQPPSYLDAANDAVSLQDDGRITVDLDSKLYRTLASLPRRASLLGGEIPQSPPPGYEEEAQPPIRLNIVIQVVGSRGDVQPFVALGCELLKHGHRVRLATHGAFQDFALHAGLEFFNIGGDPSELMAYMVRNPGLIPSMKSLRAGDVQAKQDMMAEMLRGCWRSCVSPDPISGEPFVAEAIIANPPSFAHIHCAQALCVPLHLMFTMPWTSTTSFRHPLANFISSSSSTPEESGKQVRKAAKETSNYMSYLMVEWLTWQGLGGIVNEWRGTLGLEPLPFTEGPLLAETLRVPTTYCWSPSLVPKPKDWGQHIDVCGFFFRDEPRYDPDPELSQFLRQGQRPIYIGFGSIVINDPANLTSLVIKAVREAGVRAIVSKGWSNLGADVSGDSDVYFLGDCPHEWLFQHVSMVVHHGGAGTTACGLLNGRPTTVVPFFGDQKFWGDMIAAAGAGPAPIPYKMLTVANLTEAIRVCLTDNASAAAARMAEQMRSESGVQRAVESFHANLPLSTMRCDVQPNQPASWCVSRNGRNVKLSKRVAGLLVAEGRLEWKELKSYKTQPIMIDQRYLEPVTASASSLITVTTGVVESAVDIVAKPIQAYSRPRKARQVASSSSSSQGIDQAGVSTHVHAQTMSAGSVPGGPSCADEDDGDSRLKMAVAGSAAGFGGMLKHFTKGMLDAPLAVVEGCRNAPRLYGGKVYQPGRVDGVVSGGVVAGKNMVHGIAEGFGGLVASPVRGAMSNGPVGFVQGVGIGCLNMGAKVPSGLLGLIIYPGQGVYKTIYNATHGRTRGDLKQRRRVESEHLAHELTHERSNALRQFESLLQMQQGPVRGRDRLKGKMLSFIKV